MAFLELARLVGSRNGTEAVPYKAPSAYCGLGRDKKSLTDLSR